MNFKDLVSRLDEIENTTQDDVEIIEPETDLEKAEELDDMVDQYIALNGTDDEFAEPIDANQAVAENIYESLVESFGYQAEDFSSSWDEFNKFPIVTINGTVIYDGEDLITDLALAGVIATIGPAAGPLIMPRLYKLANIIKKVFGATKPASKEAISTIAKTYKEKLAAGWRAQLGANALATSAGATMGANALILWAEKVLGNNYDPATLGNKATMPSVDTMGNATGQSN